MQLAIQPYGGGLWHTWFDRDLSVAGRILVSTGTNGETESRIIDLESPVLSIPSLAIHLNREVNTKGFICNPQTEMVPILGTVAHAPSFSDSDTSYVHYKYIYI